MPARFKYTGVWRENLSIFYNPLTGNWNFSYSLPNTQGEIAMNGNLAVLRHGCRITASPKATSLFPQTVRKIPISGTIIKNGKAFPTRPRYI